MVDEIIKQKYRLSVIFTDSLSSLLALNSATSWKHPLVSLLRAKLTHAIKQNITIHFCWVPSHIGIHGNEEADRAAGACVNRPIEIHTLPVTDYRTTLRNKIKESWQVEWDSDPHNKLHGVKPVLSEWRSARHRERFYEVILCRLRIGHTHLTHGYLLRNDDPPMCDYCSETLSVLHILLVCPQFNNERRSYFPIFFRKQIPFHLALLLGDEPVTSYRQVFNFLENINILHRL